MIHINNLKKVDKNIEETKKSIIEDIKFFVKNGVTHYHRDIYDKNVGEYLEYYFSHFLGYHTKYKDEYNSLEISWDTNSGSSSDRKDLSKVTQEGCNYNYALSSCLKDVCEAIIAALFNDFNSTNFTFSLMENENIKNLIKNEVYEILESYGVKIVIGKEEDFINLSWEDSNILEKYKSDIQIAIAEVLSKAKCNVKEGYDSSLVYLYDTKVTVGVAALLRYACGYKESMNINVYTSGEDHEVDLEIELLFDAKDISINLPQVKYHSSNINNKYCAAELHYLYKNLKLLDKSAAHSYLNGFNNFTYTCSMACVPEEIRDYVHNDTLAALKERGFEVSSDIYYDLDYRYNVSWNLSEE